MNSEEVCQALMANALGCLHIPPKGLEVGGFYCLLLLPNKNEYLTNEKKHRTEIGNRMNWNEEYYLKPSPFGVSILLGHATTTELATGSPRP